MNYLQFVHYLILQTQHVWTWVNALWQPRCWPPLPRSLWAYTANTVLFVWTSRETFKRWRRHSRHVPLRLSFCTLGSWPRPREPQGGPEEVPVLRLQRLPQRQAFSRQSHPRPQARRVNESLLLAYTVYALTLCFFANIDFPVSFWSWWTKQRNHLEEVKICKFPHKSSDLF